MNSPPPDQESDPLPTNRASRALDTITSLYKALSSVVLLRRSYSLPGTSSKPSTEISKFIPYNHPRACALFAEPARRHLLSLPSRKLVPGRSRLVLVAAPSPLNPLGPGAEATPPSQLQVGVPTARSPHTFAPRRRRPPRTREHACSGAAETPATPGAPGAGKRGREPRLQQRSVYTRSDMFRRTCERSRPFARPCVPGGYADTHGRTRGRPGPKAALTRRARRRRPRAPVPWAAPTPASARTHRSWTRHFRGPDPGCQITSGAGPAPGRLRLRRACLASVSGR